MWLADIMALTPKEFYGLYGRNAELYSEWLRNDPSLPGYGWGIQKCSETGMCHELYRYRCIYLSRLYVDGGFTPWPGLDPVPLIGISFSTDNITIAVGSTGNFTVLFSPPNATDKRLVWTISDSSIATIDPNTGLITGIKDGTVTVTATSVDGGYVATGTVNITSDVPDGTMITEDNIYIVTETNVYIIKE